MKPASAARPQCSARRRKHAVAASATLALPLLLVAAHMAAASAAGLVFPQYPVDWSLVPEDPEPASNLSSSCICALLNGTCTPSCCCDPACPSGLVKTFRAAGACLPEGAPPEQLTYCLPDEPFAKINLPAGDFYRLQKPTADADFLAQLLCITADRNPSMGKAYPDPPAGDMGTNAQEAACSADDAVSAATGSSNSASTTTYAYGQALVVQGDIPPAAASLRVRGMFVLPVPALSGECLDVQQVGFMQRLPHTLKVPASRCQRTFSTAAALSAVCDDATSLLSPTYWAGLAFPSAPGATPLKQVTLTSLARTDLATGAVTTIDPAGGVTASVAAAGPPPGCSGVVVEAHLLLRSATDPETGALQVAGVQLTLVLADVFMPPAGPLVLSTAFSASWADVAVADAALQPLSGAPGYLPGFPLLAGTAVTGPPDAGSAPGDPAAAKRAVSRLRQGLQLPGAGPAGRCSPSAQYAPVVGFGYNLTSTCSIGLSLNQLRTLCTNNNSTKPLADIMGADWLGNLTAQQVMLGTWGNADPANIRHWLPLATTGWPPATDLAWDEASATCSNIATGLKVRLLTGVAFASGNLQSKLLYGSACFTYGAWRFDRLNGPALQTFSLAFAAQFVPKAGQQPALAVKPAPPLIKPLPPDLFYPFLTSGGGPGSRRGAPAAPWGGARVLLLAAALWAGHVLARM